MNKTSNTSPASPMTPLIPATPVIPDFDSLSLPDKRRAICRDVLAQLDAGKFIAENGVFVELPKGAKIDVDGHADSLRTAISTIKSCDVCALGGIMMSQLRLNGDCKVKDVEVNVQGFLSNLKSHLAPYETCISDYKEENFSPFILRYFDPQQLSLIEIAFELGYGAFKCEGAVKRWEEGEDHGEEYRDQADYYGCTVEVEDASRAIAFGRKFNRLTGSDARLRAIMRSIINHPEALFAP